MDFVGVGLQRRETPGTVIVSHKLSRIHAGPVIGVERRYGKLVAAVAATVKSQAAAVVLTTAMAVMMAEQPAVMAIVVAFVARITPHLIAGGGRTLLRDILRRANFDAHGQGKHGHESRRNPRLPHGEFSLRASSRSRRWTTESMRLLASSAAAAMYISANFAAVRLLPQLPRLTGVRGQGQGSGARGQGSGVGDSTAVIA